MVTIRDVAKQAGVSVSTASRILSNSTKETYAQATRKKVLQASRELGYRPNFAARALASGQTNIIAAIFPRIYDTPFTALASLQIMSGIESFCSDNGYHMLITSPNIIDGKLDTHFTNLLTGGYLDGIIIDGHFNITPIMNFMDGLDIPTVVLGHYQHTYSLRSDNVEGGRLMMKHLLDLGHQHIGLIRVPDITERLEGVRIATENHGLNFDSLPYYDGSFSAESGALGATYLLENYPELTALVAFNDRMALGAMNQLRDLGYSIPDDISVVGYDDLPRSRDFNPPLTTINHKLSEWGLLSTEMLLDVINGNNPEAIVISPTLMVRQSTAVPRNQ